MAREKIEFPYPDEDFLDDELPRGVLSPSGFGSYKMCPRRFMYSYVEGIINPPAGVSCCLSWLSFRVLFYIEICSNKEKNESY